MLYPLVLKPVLKDYLWGGTKLKDVYHKKTDCARVAESWELACHAEGTSIIENGPYAGKSFREYLFAEGKCVLGTGMEALPLLVKIIDTADSLSIQVHPDGAYAAMCEGGQDGKTELWYIMDCAPGASLYYGFKKEISKEEFKRQAEDGTITEVLNRVPVKKGDTFLIAPGVVHAIGKDMTVAEIGTNSNITYRIYDFGRVDAQGKPRDLHIEKAADVLDFVRPTICALKNTLNCGAFEIERIDVAGDWQLRAGVDSFHHLLCVDGGAALSYPKGRIDIPLGTSVFVPAGMGAYTLFGNAVLLKTMVGEKTGESEGGVM